MKRASGVLMHITSLPQEEGMGTFGRTAYEFVDFLHEAGQTYWQILPLGHTGFGNSPYQAFSAFAGNPYLIDLHKLKEENLLDWEENIYLGDNSQPEVADLNNIFPVKMQLLRKAYANAKEDKVLMKKVEEFAEENADWLKDYSLFMAIKGEYQQRNWQDWDIDIKTRQPEAMKKYEEALEDEINFWNFIQYEFTRQWTALKSYANSKGIKIIGDVPIYVAADSCDTWANPNLFKLDEECRPITVAGCPPDAFSADGQLWGNPIYNWENIDASEYAWWVERIKQNAKLFDVIRIDHFRGFESFWEVPFGESTARNGEWTKAPGAKLFSVIKDKLGDLDIIAEDLGFVTPEVLELRLDAGYPGMKILQFAFSNPDSPEDSKYLPYNCEKESVAYLGTHDNDTVVGWMEDPANKQAVEFAKKYFYLNAEEGYAWGMIRGLLGTCSDLAIIQMQDLLQLGNYSRMNTPSTLGTNWGWRMKSGQLTHGLAARLKDLTKTFGRERKN